MCKHVIYCFTKVIFTHHLLVWVSILFVCLFPPFLVGVCVWYASVIFVSKILCAFSAYFTLFVSFIYILIYRYVFYCLRVAYNQCEIRPTSSIVLLTEI